MSKISRVFRSVTSMLGMGGQSINIPKPEIPAAPAPVARSTAGANVVLGTSMTDTTRTSGQGTARRRVDPLGSLGLGGLSL